jgi:hypothetical protein
MLDPFHFFKNFLMVRIHVYQPLNGTVILYLARRYCITIRGQSVHLGISASVQGIILKLWDMLGTDARLCTTPLYLPPGSDMWKHIFGHYSLCIAIRYKLLWVGATVKVTQHIVRVLTLT